MAKRVNVVLTEQQLRDLEELCRLVGLDQTNAIRYAIRKTCNAEKVSAEAVKLHEK